MQTFLWWPEGAQWRDYHIGMRSQVAWGGTSAANWLPLWAGALPPGSAEVERVIASLSGSGLLQRAGVQVPTLRADAACRRCECMYTCNRVSA